MHSEMKELLNNLNILDVLFDDVRVVNPLRKKVLLKKGEQIIETDQMCYNYWKTGEMCKNCVSMRCYYDNQTYMKIEQSGDKVFMVTAIPVKKDDSFYVVEAMKDVTRNMFYMDSVNETAIKVVDLVNNMNEIAFSDFLTEIYNRRFIDERLPVDLLKAQESNSKIALIMVDIDHFKRVNDTYGHLAGDSILVEFAKRLNGHVRGNTDWVARYGGEEFLVCLLDTDIIEAVKVADRIRNEIEQMVVVYNNKEIRITASFGVATSSDECGNYRMLLEASDSKLLEAKKTGRNRISY